MSVNKSDYYSTQKEVDTICQYLSPPAEFYDDGNISTYPIVLQKALLRSALELKPFQRYLVESYRNALVGSPSGSGKTTAIIIAALYQTFKKKRVCIVANTKELLYNMYQLCNKLCDGKVLSALLLGGTGSDRKDVAILEKQPKIIFATPGRLYDVLDPDGLIKRSRRYNRGKRSLVNLAQFSRIHIDEADALLTTTNNKTQCQMCAIIDALDTATKGCATRVFTSATYSNDAIANAVKLCKSDAKNRLEVYLPKDISNIFFLVQRQRCPLMKPLVPEVDSITG